MKIKNGEFVGFLIISRIPNLAIIGYTQFATAWFLLDASFAEILSPAFAGLLLSTAAIGAGGYIINDYFDRKFDMINRPHTVIVGTRISRRTVLSAHALLSFFGIATGFVIDSGVGVAHTFSALLLWLYSSMLKRRLLLGIFSLALLVAMSIFIILLFFGDFNFVAVTYAFFGSGVVFIRESLKDMISYKGENVFGVKSAPLVWGIRGAKLLICAVCLAGMMLLIIYLWSVPDRTVRMFFVGLTPFLVWFIVQLKEADREKEFVQLKHYMDLIIVSGLISMSLV